MQISRDRFQAGSGNLYFIRSFNLVLKLLYLRTYLEKGCPTGLLSSYSLLMLSREIPTTECLSFRTAAEEPELLLKYDEFLLPIYV